MLEERKAPLRMLVVIGMPLQVYEEIVREFV
jgi:hypothetical protein